ncbi:unnamed protein product [Caenorhabditis auriculariae]|uniref:Uncharacterized protein n=1 Tax=Caenorhabditis auriculariae TaxID=2777116 RepID=A0A8S1GQR8_9PELO|nr:unnamed protein product [Caenorhabditis auriculariae]
MGRKNLKHRLKITKASLDRFCHELRIVQFVNPSGRNRSCDRRKLLADDEATPRSNKGHLMEKLDLSDIGSSDFEDEEKRIYITALRRGFDLPCSPRVETDKGGENRRNSWRSLESPRAFLNGEADVSSLPSAVSRSSETNGLGALTEVTIVADSAEFDHFARTFADSCGATDGIHYSRTASAPRAVSRRPPATL